MVCKLTMQFALIRLHHGMRCKGSWRISLTVSCICYWTQVRSQSLLVKRHAQISSYIESERCPKPPPRAQVVTNHALCDLVSASRATYKMVELAIAPLIYSAVVSKTCFTRMASFCDHCVQRRMQQENRYQGTTGKTLRCQPTW